MREKEGLFDLPESWSWTIASEVCASVRDGTHDTPKYVEKGIPLITSKNLREGEIDFSTAKFISLEDHQQISVRSGVEDGDVLFAMIGTVGNPVLVKADKEFSIKNVGLFKKNDFVIDSRYLKSWLSSSTLDKLIEKQGLLKGTTQKFIPLGNLRNLPTPLPPLNEQRRIVAKIEALKARSQRVKEELEAIPALLDQFRQSVLAAAFRGDLTADWREKNPDVEPASVLLERIRAERRRRWEEVELEKMKAQGKTPKDDKWKEKYREPELSNQSNLPEIPKEWLWTTMDEIADIDLGKMLDRGKKHKGKLFPYLRNINVRWGYIDLTDLLEMDFSQDEIERFSLKKNDVLVCEGGEPGRSAIWEGFDSDIKYQKTLHRVRPFLEIPPLWFVYHLKLNSSRGILENYFSGSTIKHFTKISFQRYAVRLANLEEQKEIIRRIQSLFRAANKIQQQYEETKAYLDKLNQSILAKAFRGELVPQDPNDEPASVLLERIRAEQEKLDTKKKAKGKTEKKSRKAKPEPAEPEQLSLPGFE